MRGRGGMRGGMRPVRPFGGPGPYVVNFSFNLVKSDIHFTIRNVVFIDQSQDCQW